MPYNDSVTHVRGDTFARTYTMTYTEGGAVDLTGWTVTSQLRATPDGDVLQTFTVTVADPPDSGIFTLALTGVQAAALPLGTVVFDVQLVNGSTGEVWTPISGKLTVVADVTR